LELTRFGGSSVKLMNGRSVEQDCRALSGCRIEDALSE